MPLSNMYGTHNGPQIWGDSRDMIAGRGQPPTHGDPPPRGGVRMPGHSMGGQTRADPLARQKRFDSFMTGRGPAYGVGGTPTADLDPLASMGGWSPSGGGMAGGMESMSQAPGMGSVGGYAPGMGGESLMSPAPDLGALGGFGSFGAGGPASGIGAGADWMNGGMQKPGMVGGALPMGPESDWTGYIPQGSAQRPINSMGPASPNPAMRSNNLMSMYGGRRGAF